MGFNDNKNKGEAQSHFAAAGPKKRVPAFTVTSRVPPPGSSSFHAQGLALFCFLFVIDPPCFFSGFRRVHDVYSEDDRLSEVFDLVPASLSHPSLFCLVSSPSLSPAVSPPQQILPYESLRARFQMYSAISSGWVRQKLPTPDECNRHPTSKSTSSRNVGGREGSCAWAREDVTLMRRRVY